MAMKVEIEVEVLPDGTIRMHTHGIKGAKCDEELRPIERALGRVKDHSRTREYYEQNSPITKNINSKTN